MKAFVAVLATAAAASAGDVPAAAPAGVVIPAPVVPAATLVRAPAHDSATIEHKRLGGNFAYGVAEAHAFAKVTPQIASRTVAVGETTHVHTPAAIKTIQPGAITTTHHVARPVLAQQPIYRQEPVIGPVATHTTYEQPIYKTRTITHTGVQTHTRVAAAPAVAVAAAPVAAAVPAVGAVGYAAAPAAAGVIAAPAAGLVHGAGLGYGLGAVHGGAILAGAIAAPAIAADAVIAEH